MAHRQPLLVLKLCDNDETKYLWKHAWMTRRKSIEESLVTHGISIMSDLENDPIARPNESFAENFEVAIITAFSKFIEDTSYATQISLNVLHVEYEEVNQIVQMRLDEDVGIYRGKDKNCLWFVGHKERVDRVVKSFEREARKMTGHSKDEGDERSSDSSFENVMEPVNLQLTEKEMAIMWIKNLFGIDCLLKENVSIKSQRFDFEISVPDTQAKAVIEEKIREKINSQIYDVQSKCLQFSPRVYKFLTREELHTFLNSKVNLTTNKINCLWYKGDQNTITLYSNISIESKCGLFTNSIKEESVPVPWRYFRTEQAQQKILEIEKKYKGKVSLEINPNCDAVHVLHTSDLSQPTQEVKKMFTTRSIEIFDKVKGDSCRLLFPKLKDGIENELSVNIDEPDQKKRYGWVIKGGESSVLSAYTVLCKLKESIKTERKTYITEECIDIAQSKIAAINERSTCHVSLLTDNVSSNTRWNKQKTTDLREQISCRSLKMKDGSHVTIYRGYLNQKQWMRQDCLVVTVFPASDEQSFHMNINNDKEHCYQATTHLPVWNDGKSQEKERIGSIITGIISFVESSQNSVQSVTFDLEEVRRVNWPITKYLKYILGSLRGKKPLVNLHFYAAPANYEITSNIVHKWIVSESDKSEPKVRITILKEELAKVKCDVLVNSTSGNLQLDRGVVSNSLLKAGGDELQYACNRYLSSQNASSISYTDVVITNGYGLSSKHVFHGVLPGFNTSCSPCFGNFIENCLHEANKLKLRTIAFPALGTGKLAYPHQIVAETMMSTVQQFIMKNPNGSLDHVYFVIFPSDYKSIQAFEDKEKEMKSKELEWHDAIVTSPPVYCNVQVIGQCDQDIQSTFQEIENSIKETEREVSQGDIYIPPSSPFVEPEKQESQIQNREGKTDTGENIQNISKDDRRETAVDIDNIGSSDNTFLPPQESYTSEDQSVRQRSTCHVEVVLQACQNRDPWDQFEKTFRLHNIKSDQIIWNPATAMKARLKFKSEYEANVFIKNMEKERIFQVQMSSIDAVVNIRAKLNKKMDKYLKREENQLLLSKHSGVFIDCLNGETTLFGDLMEISTARDILLSWGKEENKAESSCRFQEDEFEKHHVYNKPENLSKEQVTLTTPCKDSVISDTSVTSERNVIQENGNLKMQVFTDDRNGLPARQSNIGDIKSAEKNLGIGGLKPEQGMVSQTQTSSPSRVDTQNHHSNNSASTLDPKFQQQNMQGTKPGLYPKLNESKNNSIEFDEKSTGAIRKYSKQTNESGTGSTMKSEGADRYHPLTQQIKQNAYNYKDEKHNIAGTSDQYNQSFFKPEDDSIMMETKERVKVFVYKADICYLDNVDCIVNSSNSGMNHSMGLSEVIAKRAGKTMEDECKAYLREFGTLSSDSICITSAGNLSHYKRIVHVNAPNAKLNLKPEEFSVALSSSVKNCLIQANKDRMTSCAFPAVSSGHGGIPKDVCYSSYPAGVIRFSRKLKKPTVKEVHFVDRDQDVVDLMQAAFLNAVREENEHSKGWKDKWLKIPQKTKDLFKSHIRDESQAGKYLELHLDNKTVVIVCDGGLLNSLKHPHVENVTKLVGYGQWKPQETVLVIAEDVDFSGKSQTAQKCLKRGGKSFSQNYNSVKTIQRKKIGSVLESYGANNMDIFNVLFSILPKFSNSAKVKYSSEQNNFFEFLYNSFLNILLAADKSGYKHLSTPLFCADFYNNSDEWFMVRSTRDMLSAVRTFAKSRQGKGFMVIHIVTDGNDKLFQILNAQMREISV